MSIQVFEGTRFNVNGSGFLAGSLVYVNGVLANDIEVVTARRIRCNAPANPFGPADVKVVNPDTQEYILASAVDYQTVGTANAALSRLAGSGSGTLSFTGSGGGALAPLAGTGTGTATDPGTDPATFALRFYVKPNYSGTPWAGASSAGISGTASYGVKAGSAPATGTAVNGLVPASFNGTTNYLTTTGTAQVTPFLATGPSSRWVGTMFFVFKVNTTNAPTGFALSDTAFFQGSSGSVSMGAFSTSGFGGGFGFVAPGYVACSTGAWHFGAVRIDGTNMDVNVDAAAKTTFGKFGAATDGAFHMGTNNAATLKFLDGDILYAGGMGTVMSDADIIAIGKYFQAQTGLSFGF